MARKMHIRPAKLTDRVLTRRTSSPKKKATRTLNKAACWREVEATRGPAQRVAAALLRRWGAKLPAEEVTSAVDIALCEAIQRYTPSRQTTFLTFAFLYIKGHLVRQIKRSMTEHQNTEFAHDYTDGADMSSAVDSSYLYDAALSSGALGDAGLSTEQHAMNQEAQALGQELFAALPERERSILYRIFILEEQISRVAKDMGYSRHHLFRIKRAATQQLQELHSKKIV